MRRPTLPPVLPADPAALGVAVGAMVQHPALALVAADAGVGLVRTVHVPRIQKPGLALTGWPEQLHRGRVLVLGGAEMDYLEAQASEAVRLAVATMLASAPACIVICRGRGVPPELLTAARAKDVAVLVSGLVTADFIAELNAFLGVRLAPRTEVHGVLMDVLGVGVLMMGKSGIGKSETALDLVVRGHRFVCDDVVELRRLGEAISGYPSATLGHHMEVRGLGIINIKDLFGISAVRDAKKVELVVELVEWADEAEYDRLGFDDMRLPLLGIEVPCVTLPVRPGRNLATLIEVAARNQLLKEQGHHSAHAFRQRLHQAMHGGLREVAVGAAEGIE